MRRGVVVALALAALVVATALAVPASPVARSGPPGDGPADPAVEPVGEPPPAIVPAGNATAYLAPPADAIETTGYARAPLDVAGVLAIDAAAIEDRLADAVAEERFAGADSATRREWLRTSAARIEARVTALRERQAAAIQGFNDGTTAERLFLRELAAIHAAADDLEAAVARVETRSRSVSGITIGGDLVTAWARDRRLAIGTLRGPVRERLAATIDSEVAPPPIHVETTDTGVVLSAIDGNRYYREAVLPGLRPPANASQEPGVTSTTSGVVPTTPSGDTRPTTPTPDDAGPATPNGTDSATTTPDETTREPAITSIADAIDRVTALYAGAGRETIGTDSIGGEATNVSRVTLFYDRGRLTAYVDRATGTVFAEQQYRRLTAVQAVESTTNATDTLALTVNRTHPTGPLEVSLAEPVTGEAVNGTVAIDGVPIDTTGADGRLWTLQPRGAFTVTARQGNQTVTVAVDPSA